MIEINYLAFFISFAIGVLFVFLSTPKPEVIYKYPTPENVHATIYKDLAENCYKYNAQEVQCSKNAKDTPVQHVDIEKKENESAITSFGKKYFNN